MSLLAVTIEVAVQHRILNAEATLSFILTQRCKFMSGERTKVARVESGKRGNDNRVRTYGKFKFDDQQVEVLAMKYRDLLMRHHHWEREVNHLQKTESELIQILSTLSRKDLVEFNAMDYLERSFNTEGN